MPSPWNAIPLAVAGKAEGVAVFPAKGSSPEPVDTLRGVLLKYF